MLNLEIRPKITKEYLLSILTEEQIFCYYCGINFISKNLIKNPTRVDKKVTCGFYRNKTNTLILHDFATGEYFNCFTLVAKLHNCDFHRAVKIIASDFGIAKTEKPSIQIRKVPKFETSNEPTIIQIEKDNFSEQDLKWWSSFGISEKTLNKYRVFTCKTVFLNTKVFCRKTQYHPVYGYYFGKKQGIEQWKIYMPNRKEFRFLNNLNQKVLQGYHQLPKSGKLLVIQKSMKDVMLLHEFGIPSTAPQSENTFMDDKSLEELKSRFKYIVVMMDNDRPGLMNLIKFRKLHPELNYVFIPRKYKAKDLTDFYRKYGDIATKKLIKSYLNYLKRI